MHAVRRDVADIALADRVFAPHYARATPCHCVTASTMLRGAPGDEAIAVSQLLAGEAFALLDVAAGWAWGYSAHDNYVGYVRADALGRQPEATHVVPAASALVFAEPDIKSPLVATLPIGARLSGVDDRGFVAGAGGFVHPRHLRAIDPPESDPVAVAERITGMPYLWGGRGGGGIDCSGLVQVALGLCGIAAPRDSDQQRVLGREIAPGQPLRRGDLIFFPGHVGLMVDADRMIHANAYRMAVTIEPLADVVARLSAAHAEPVLARRRLA